MANRPKMKGTAWEAAVLHYLRSAGYQAERLALKGAEDEGDIVVEVMGGYVIVECKAERHYDLSSYMRQIKLEQRNFAAHRGIDPHLVNGVVMLKRRMHGVSEAYAIEEAAGFWGIRPKGSDGPGA